MKSYCWKMTWVKHAPVFDLRVRLTKAHVSALWAFSLTDIKVRDDAQQISHMPFGIARLYVVSTQNEVVCWKMTSSQTFTGIWLVPVGSRKLVYSRCGILTDRHEVRNRCRRQTREGVGLRTVQERTRAQRWVRASHELNTKLCSTIVSKFDDG